jgi:hypothetical protein
LPVGALGINIASYHIGRGKARKVIGQDGAYRRTRMSMCIKCLKEILAMAASHDNV